MLAKLRHALLADGGAGESDDDESDIDDVEGAWLRDAIEQRLRASDDDATTLRRALEAAARELREARARAAAAEEKYNDQAELTAQLESHLQMTTGGGSGGGAGGGGGGGAGGAGGPLVSGGGGDGAAVLPTGAGGAAQPGPGPGSMSEGGPKSSMLQILKQQRDRFKSQMLAQSARAEQQRALADEAAQRVSKLERDNVALYEKIRFLQAWKPKQARGGGGGAGGSAVEQQYGALYRNGLDPFAAFKKREREAGGSFIERRLVGALASRRFREIAALYLVLLHGVVYVRGCVLPLHLPLPLRVRAARCAYVVCRDSFCLVMSLHFCEYHSYLGM